MRRTCGIDPSGFPLIAASLCLAILAGALSSLPWSILLLAVTALLVYFFRDPERPITVAANEVVAPADGRVVAAGEAPAALSPPGGWKQVGIFLSPTDVHVNRIPVSGRVISVRYVPGRFAPAWRPSAGLLNARNELWLDHDGQLVVARQIAGGAVRRIVCRAREGSMVNAGDRYGIMKFGSRMDVLLPETAILTVAIGQKVRGGQTVIAVLPRAG